METADTLARSLLLLTDVLVKVYGTNLRGGGGCWQGNLELNAFQDHQTKRTVQPGSR